MHSKSYSKKLAYAAPIIMAIVGLVLYSYILPAKYMKAISLIDWLFSGSDHIIATLRDADGVLEQFYKILLTKVIVWIWSAGFVISLFVCGHALQNRRTANLSAKLVGPVLSPLADTLVSMVQGNIPQNSINFMRLIEAIIDIEQPFSPKLASKRLEDGTMYSPPPDDMAPFLDREEYQSALDLLRNS